MMEVTEIIDNELRDALKNIVLVDFHTRVFTQKRLNNFFVICILRTFF